MESPELSQNQEENLDEQIENLLTEAENLLPANLKKQYEEKYENAETDQEVKGILNKLQSALEHRKNNLTDKMPEIENEIISKKCTEEELKQIRNQIESLQEKINKGSMPSLGEGRVAEVFSGWESSPFCFKIIKKEKEAINIYRTENNIKRESELLQEVSQKIDIEGVRVPKFHYYQANSEMHFMVMENLDAITLEEAMKKRENFPPGFDAEKFFTSLENFVKELNQNRIYHKDLHKGNIMVDKNDGTCYVIDFGTAGHYIDENKAFQKKDPKTDNMVKITSDINNARKHRKDFEEAFNNNL